MTLHVVPTTGGLGYKPRPLDRREEDICNAWAYVDIVYQALAAWVTNYGAADKLPDAWNLMRQCRVDGMSPLDACNKIREKIFGQKNVH